MDAQIDPGKGYADHQKPGDQPGFSVAQVRGQISPDHHGMLGVTAGQPAANRMGNRLNPRIIYKWPGLIG